MEIVRTERSLLSDDPLWRHVHKICVLGYLSSYTIVYYCVLLSCLTSYIRLGDIYPCDIYPWRHLPMSHETFTHGHETFTHGHETYTHSDIYP